jgi:hypothetical protein
MTSALSGTGPPKLVFACVVVRSLPPLLSVHRQSTFPARGDELLLLLFSLFCLLSLVDLDLSAANDVKRRRMFI